MLINRPPVAYCQDYNTLSKLFQAKNRGFSKAHGSIGNRFSGPKSGVICGVGEIEGSIPAKQPLLNSSPAVKYTHKEQANEKFEER